MRGRKFYLPVLVFAGGADASLLLTIEELARPENTNDDFAVLTARAAKKIASWFDISVADTLAVCAAVAPEVLSNGRIKILNGKGRGLRVGRLDCSTPAAPNQLPSASADLNTFIKFWADRGINETEAVALMGSHSLVDSQGCFAGDKPNNYCDPATQDCTNVRMFRWENHYYRDICSPTIKVKAVDPVRDPPEPADTPVLAMSEPELDAEARLETCKFTSQEGRVMALNRLKKWQTGAAQEPDAVREPLAVSWSNKFCRAGERWGVTPSNCPHSNDWWYTPNDALIGQACQDESSIGITGANAGRSKIRDAARLFQNQSSWDEMYRVAYIKMVEAFAYWSLKTPFYVSGAECATGVQLQAACAFKPSPPAPSAASNDSMAVVKELYDGLYQPAGDKNLTSGFCKACAAGVCPVGNGRCPMCINHFNNYMATTKKKPVNLNADACCGCASIMREYRYVPPASGTGTGTIISIPYASRFGALLAPTQLPPQPLSDASVPPVPERRYEPDPSIDAVAESVLVNGAFSDLPLSPYSDPSAVCPAADGTSVNVRGFPSSPFKWMPFVGSNGKPANAFSWPPRAQRAHTYHKPGTNLTIDTFEIDIKVIKKDLGCPNGPTELLSYNGSIPGPTFRIRKGHQTLVRYNNLMTTDYLSGTRFEPFHPCDGMRANGVENNGGRGISVHLHGEASLAPYDGWAEDTTCGGYTKDYYYSNRRTGFAWYHDHQVDITSENAYFGLAGMYVVTDSKYEEGCGEPWNLDELPDVPMILKDMVFDDKCQLLYDREGPHRINLYGDVNTVNGVAWPTLDLQPRWNRFRFLNAAVTRPWKLRLVDAVTGDDVGGQVCKVIAGEGGPRHKPTQFPAAGMFIGVAERYEVVCDFTNYAGKSLYLWNAYDKHRMKDVPFFCNSHLIMKINIAPCPSPDAVAIEAVANAAANVVDADAASAALAQTGPAVAVTATCAPPGTAFGGGIESRPVLDTVMSDADIAAALTMVRNKQCTRTFRFGRRHGRWVINGETWHSARVAASMIGQNTWEVWCLETGGGWFHPIHIHLVDFYVLARNWDEAQVYEYERWTAKDVVQLNPSGHVALLLRFGPHRGEYMFHCHNLVHEDSEMMRSYSVSQTAGSKTAATALPMQNLEPTLLTTQNVIYDLYNDPVYPDWAAKPSSGFPTRLWDLTTPAAETAAMTATTYPLNAGIYRIFYPGGGPANEDPRLRDPTINPWIVRFCRDENAPSPPPPSPPLPPSPSPPLPPKEEEE